MAVGLKHYTRYVKQNKNSPDGHRNTTMSLLSRGVNFDALWGEMQKQILAIITLTPISVVTVLEYVVTISVLIHKGMCTRSALHLKICPGSSMRVLKAFWRLTWTSCIMACKRNRQICFLNTLLDGLPITPARNTSTEFSTTSHVPNPCFSNVWRTTTGSRRNRMNVVNRSWVAWGLSFQEPTTTMKKLQFTQ